MTLLRYIGEGGYKMSQLQCYTRVALESDIYDEKLAYSMHIALREGDKVIALNHNSGVLFARAIWNEDGGMLILFQFPLCKEF